MLFLTPAPVLIGEQHALKMCSLDVRLTSPRTKFIEYRDAVRGDNNLLPIEPGTASVTANSLRLFTFRRMNPAYWI